jgi:putative hydrolase of the HAD superfamily
MVVKKLTDITSSTDLVLLDMDNTLYDYQQCHETGTQSMLNLWSQRFGGDTRAFEEAYKRSRQDVKKKYPGKAISHSRLFYSQGAVEEILNITDAGLIMELYAAYWDNFISSMKLHDDVLPFLTACKEKNIPVVMITDMTAHTQFRKVVHLGINDYLNFIVTSEEAGVEKPDSAIYLLAIEKARRIKKEIRKIVMIGDDDERDTFVSDGFEVVNYHVKRT